MTDIVDWLRYAANEHNMYRCDEAADEIERLREAMVEIVCLIGDRDRRQEVMDIAKPYAIQQLALKGNRPHVYVLNEDNQG
jgi:hypothetical protein